MSSMKIVAGDDLKRADMLFVNPFEIVVKEELRGRCEPPSEEAIIDLAESMMDPGQLQVVQCRKLPDHRLQLNFGFSRMAAARLIRTGFVGTDGQHRQDENFKLKVVVSVANDQAAFISNIIENCQRNATNDLDDAHNQNRLREQYGYSDAEIAKLYKDRSGRVARLRTLLSAPTPIQDMVSAGVMSTPAVVEMMELPAEKRDEAVQAVLESSPNGTVSGPAMRAQVRDHHLRDAEDESAVRSAANSEKPKDNKKKPLSIAEMRAWVESERDAATDGTCRHKLLDTLHKFMAGQRSSATMKKVLTETVGE